MAKAEKTATPDMLDLEDAVTSNLNMVASTLRLVSEARNYDPADMNHVLGHLAKQLGDAREAFAALLAEVRS